jgi:hypothetical protein
MTKSVLTTSPYVDRKLALSIADAVRLSGIGRTVIFAEIRRGRLVARKCGRRTVILSDDLTLWLRALPSIGARPVSDRDAGVFEFD